MLLEGQHFLIRTAGITADAERTQGSPLQGFDPGCSEGQVVASASLYGMSVKLLQPTSFKRSTT